MYGIFYITASQNRAEMRKAIVEVILNPEIKSICGGIFDTVRSIELVKLLRIDFERGTKLGIGIYEMKDGFSIDDVDLPAGVKIIDILNVEGNRYTCIVKNDVPHKLKPFMKKFDIDVIWDVPCRVTEERIVCCVLGTQEDLKKFLDLITLFGRIETLSCETATYLPQNILSCLTEKQREVLQEAKRSGYYEYPRKVNGKELSQNLGISKAATIEHLRKAEARIMQNILSGY
jgi:predicted DNA binding protein